MTFSKLMNIVVFIVEYCKTMENVRKHRDINLVTTGKRRNYLVSEPNYHTIKFFHGTFISNRNDKCRSSYE